MSCDRLAVAVAESIDAVREEAPAGYLHRGNVPRPAA